MKNLIAAILFISLLSACSGTQIPIAQPTSLPTIPPGTAPSATSEIPNPSPDADPTVAPAIASSPTAEPLSERVSPVDGMPQVYIPAGTLSRGGMDVRRAPNELPVHDVTLDAFWMDQLEVTNGMFALCVGAGN
ncbi:MAG TPA: SUMF1/EgtB/PvdO family nonheme iron enzyme, partial [Anaerolineales bacterium]|nr:SUMF1/EgtB/PvdO family nonheme iron enzyme [Anaerolineales bacterium]